MEKTAELIDRINFLATEIQNNILKLEKKHFHQEEIFKLMLNKNAELVRLSRQGPAYIQERAIRLQQLLIRTSREIGYSPNRFAVLLRQIDHLQHPLLSDFFSPLLKGHLNGIGSKKKEATGEKKSLHIYTLGGIYFGIIGRIIRHLKNIDISRKKRIFIRGKRLELFPEKCDIISGNANLNLDILIVFQNRRLIGLWCQEIIESMAADDVEIKNNIESLTIKHPDIAGRIRIMGRNIHLLKG